MISRRKFFKQGAATVAGAALVQGITSPAEAGTATGAVPDIASRTIRAAQMTAYRRPLQVVEVPVAAPQADGALIRVEACGICRSDWHFWNQDWGWMGLDLPLPTVLGHEVGGVVEEVGRDVRTVKVGDRVTIPFHEADGTCAQCRAGYQNLCENVIIPGRHRTGGWAQYVTAPRQT